MSVRVRRIIRRVEPSASTQQRCRKAGVCDHQHVQCFHTMHLIDDICRGKPICRVLLLSVNGQPITALDICVEYTMTGVIDQKAVAFGERGAKARVRLKSESDWHRRVS